MIDSQDIKNICVLIFKYSDNEQCAFPCAVYMLVRFHRRGPESMCACVPLYVREREKKRDRDG